MKNLVLGPEFDQKYLKKEVAYWLIGDEGDVYPVINTEPDEGALDLWQYWPRHGTFLSVVELMQIWV